jgi:hypothetical protein
MTNHCVGGKQNIYYKDDGVGCKVQTCQILYYLLHTHIASMRQKINIENFNSRIKIVIYLF